MNMVLYKQVAICVALTVASTFLYAQNVGIGTLNPLARLQVSDSSVLFSSSTIIPAGNEGNTPYVGNGRRLLWYANKGAFRVGYALATDDNKDSIGLYSVGLGRRVRAKGENSVAIGSEAKALASGAMALGPASNASGLNSTAIGYAAKAIGILSTAIGYSVQSGGTNSMAFGVYTTSPSYAETAMGIYNTEYTPSNINGWSPTDRLFSIGRGQADDARRNALTILKNGNMGLGTTEPHAQLQLDNFAVNRKIVLYEQADNDHQFYGLGVNGGILRYQVNDVVASHIFYAATSATTSAELMRIQGNGRVGIGTAAPDQLLTVNGNASKPGGGSWATFSDGRLKKNVADYTAGLDEILAIHPVSFQYNELSGYTDTDARYVGIIAQEMEKILPATISVVGGDDKVKDKRQFDGSELTYTLVNAIKQEHALVETLRKENEALKARLATVERALGLK